MYKTYAKKKLASAWMDVPKGEGLLAPIEKASLPARALEGIEEEPEPEPEPEPATSL